MALQSGRRKETLSRCLPHLIRPEPFVVSGGHSAASSFGTFGLEARSNNCYRGVKGRAFYAHP